MFFFLLFYFCPLSSVGCSFSECVHLSVCLPRPPSIPCASFTLLYKIKIDYFFSTCCNVSTFWQLLCLEYITEFVLFFLRCSVFFSVFFHHIHVFAFHCMWEPYVCFVVFIFVFVSVILSWIFFSSHFRAQYFIWTHLMLFIFRMYAIFFDLFIYLFFVLLIILFYFVYCILTFTCAVCCYLFFSYWYFFLKHFNRKKRNSKKKKQQHWEYPYHATNHGSSIS